MRKDKKRNIWLSIFLPGLVIILSGCGLLGGTGTEEIKSLQQQYEEVQKEKQKREQKKQKNETAESESKKKTNQDVKDTESQKKNHKDDDSNAYEYAEYDENYVYGTLNSQTQQVYHEVLNAILEHKEKIEVSTLEVNVLEDAYKAVCADYGGLFWVSGYVYTQYTKGDKLVGMDFSPKYIMDYEERKQTQEQIDASVEELLAGISATDSDYTKAKYVFEILVQNVDYDASAEHNQNIISAFLSRSTVCQGYACATQYLLRLLGIQSAIVTGTAQGESHAWNLVCLDGKYYYMDTTWGNSRYLDNSSETEKYVNYNYLAVTSEEMSRTHTLNKDFSLPECSSMDANYFVMENRYFSEWNPAEIGAVLEEVWNAGGSQVAVKFSSQELYRQALRYFVEEQHIADYCVNITSIYYLQDEKGYVLTFQFS